MSSSRLQFYLLGSASDRAAAVACVTAARGDLPGATEAGRMQRVRVLVAPTPIGALSVGRGRALPSRSGWPTGPERDRVVPVGDAGAGFVSATADLVGAARAQSWSRASASG